MDRGRIEQLSSPEDVYLHPATPFVASFIGEMNLVPAQVASGRIDSALGTLRGVEPRQDGEIVVGIRPESVSVEGSGAPADGSSVSVRVTDRRLVGEMCRVEGRTGNDTLLIARRPRSEWDSISALRDGESVTFSWDPADLVVLDRGA
jgi:ABC-type Fe3+/spermidine/putrescine transport system ATPase subunit